MTANLPSRGTLVVHPRTGPTIHRLPDEILLYIFKFFNDAVAVHKREFRIKPPRRHACHWMPLMLVCRRWREVGRAYPSLWQAIDVRGNMQLLQLAIDRSQGAPLSLCFYSLSITRSSISLLTQQTHRLRTLLLRPVNREDVHSLHTLLSTNLPVLHELGVWADKREDIAAIGTRPSESSAIAFDATHFPKLRLLRLSYMNFHWEPSTVSHLQYLNLYGCHSVDRALHFEQFLDVLVGCPELEELRLHRFISTLSNPIPAAFEREVILPRLRKLVVGDVPRLIRLFLSHISLTPHITLRLIGWIDSPPVGDASLLLSMLPEDHGRLPILRSATAVEFSAMDRLIIRGSSPDASITVKLISKTIVLTPYVDRTLTHLGTIFKNAPVEKLELGIWCSSDTFGATALWIGLLAAFPALRCLRVQSGLQVRPIWHALGGRSFDLLQEITRHALCPKLRDVRVDYIQWQEDAMDYVLASLRRRAMRGLPKLAYLELMFMPNDDAEDKEIEHMLPFYMDHMDTYCDDFSWDFAW
ncbi:hypothetical protein OH76DRAFT_1392154 [Lentinus brumalis]|uniref:F-box domain-containing protein n=1 Tax=Lentinus brumalis TaxID=2498619 RepID=A0A371CPN4_9APHY|nr:hypothetical protein OH76DRAFT_1392154 [Polyporus brumalis]